MPNIFGFHYHKRDAGEKAAANAASQQEQQAQSATSQSSLLPLAAQVQPDVSQQSKDNNVDTVVSGSQSTQGFSSAQSSTSKPTPTTMPGVPASAPDMNMYTGLPMRNLKGRYKLQDLSLIHI